MHTRFAFPRWEAGGCEDLLCLCQVPARPHPWGTGVIASRSIVLPGSVCPGPPGQGGLWQEQVSDRISGSAVLCSPERGPCCLGAPTACGDPTASAVRAKETTSRRPAL